MNCSGTTRPRSRARWRPARCSVPPCRPGPGRRRRCCSARRCRPCARCSSPAPSPAGSAPAPARPAGRGQGDRALHARCDHVVLAQHVAEDGLDHRMQRFAFEVEGGLAGAGAMQRRRRARAASRLIIVPVPRRITACGAPWLSRAASATPSAAWPAPALGDRLPLRCTCGADTVLQPTSSARAKDQGRKRRFMHSLYRLVPSPGAATVVACCSWRRRAWMRSRMACICASLGPLVLAGGVFVGAAGAAAAGVAGTALCTDPGAATGAAGAAPVAVPAARRWRHAPLAPQHGRRLSALAVEYRQFKDLVATGADHGRLPRLQRHQLPAVHGVAVEAQPQRAVLLGGEGGHAEVAGQQHAGQAQRTGRGFAATSRYGRGLRSSANSGRSPIAL